VSHQKHLKLQKKCLKWKILSNGARMDEMSEIKNGWNG
jgi:hypothetical protein